MLNNPWSFFYTVFDSTRTFSCGSNCSSALTQKKRQQKKNYIIRPQYVVLAKIRNLYENYILIVVLNFRKSLESPQMSPGPGEFEDSDRRVDERVNVFFSSRNWGVWSTGPDHSDRQSPACWPATEPRVSHARCQPVRQAARLPPLVSVKLPANCLPA